jgi:dUTP pyrophosphatase
MQIRIKRIREGATLPRYMTGGASGMDLAACLDEPLVLAPMARAAVPTGLVLEIEPGFEGQVRPRSGGAIRQGLTLINPPGTIDVDFRGEVCVLMINLGAEPVTIQSGDRIAQLVVAPAVRAEIVEVREVGATERGAGGFGSTGRT